MSRFWAVVQLAIQQQLRYRLAIFAGLVTNFFFAVLRSALFLALYAGSPNPQEMSTGQVLAFVAVSQGLIAFMSVFGYFDIMRSVYSGAIASDLLRPMAFFTYWLGRDLGKSLVNLALRGVVQVAFFMVLFKIPILITGWNWLGFALALTLSWLVSFSWRFLVNLAALWIPDAMGVGRAAYSFSQLLSGFIVPMGLMPVWFQKVAYLTPFPAMIAMPADIFLGRIRGLDLLPLFLTQVIWLAVMIIFSQIVLRRGMKKLVVQGG